MGGRDYDKKIEQNERSSSSPGFSRLSQLSLIVKLETARRGKAAPDIPNSKKLYVGNLAAEVTEKMLRKNFKKYGNLKLVKLVTNNITGQSKGYAFVEFTTSAAASKAKL